MAVERNVSKVGAKHGTWTPVLKGATNDPTSVVTTVLYGRYLLVGKLCFFSIRIVTSSFSKVTLTDQIRITLPFTSKSDTNNHTRCAGIAVANTPVQVANSGRIAPNTNYIALSQINVAAAEKAITYAAADPGIGNIAAAITFEFSGCYEIA